MRLMPFLLLGLALLACPAARKAPPRRQPAWARHFQGWQKSFCMVALLAALVIMWKPAPQPEPSPASLALLAPA